MSSIENTAASQRKKAIPALVILIILDCMAIWFGKRVPIYIFSTLIVIFTAGMIFPPILTIMETFGGWAGKILTIILLGVIYYSLISPIGLVMRLFGKDLLDRKLEPDRDSYWVSRKDKPFDKDSLEKQF